MDNRKISELEPATLPAGLDNADLIPIARGTTTRRVLGLNFKNAILNDINASAAIPNSVNSLLSFQSNIETGSTTFNGLKTFANSIRLQTAANRDAITIAGRSGGTLNYSLNITPGILTGTRAYTLPDVGSNAEFVMSAGNQTLNGIKTFLNSINFTATAVQNVLNLGGNNITNVNNLTFADPGNDEGLSWLGGNLWKIYESPNNLTNNSGNLQIVQNTTRRATFNTSGQLELPVTTGTAPLVITSTTRVQNLNVAGSETADRLLTSRTLWGQSFNGSANVTGDINVGGAITNSSSIQIGTQANKVTITYTGNTARNYTLPNVSNSEFIMSAGGQSITNRLSLYSNTISNDVFNGGIELREVNGVAEGQTTTNYSPALTFHWGNIAAAKLRMDSDGHFRFQAQGTNTNSYRNVYANTFIGNLQGNASTVTDGVYINGNQTINGTKTFTSRIVTPQGINSGGVDVSAAGGAGGISGTNGDGASSTVANVRITSWWGIGFSPSIPNQPVPQWENATWIDVRNGNFTTRGDVTAYASDERLKTNFLKIGQPIDKIKQISGYEFDWLNEKCILNGFKPSKKHEHGLKAQEILNIIPDAVEIAPFDTLVNKEGEKTSKTGENYLTVKYEKLVPLLIEAIKELTQRIEILENRQ